ncbi:pectinesterase [Cryptomeria japonica]|uniref:pectinesterase n=1 Tax=Cryptomeria japonica TaxID=3369 RepID=UPI0027DA5E1E|nr:pectinesterase [Cryptomeria japonica]
MSGRRRKRMAKPNKMIVATILLLISVILVSSLGLSTSFRGTQQRNLLQKSASDKINLACQASQYPELCKSSLSQSPLITPNSSPEEIISAAMTLSDGETQKSYNQSRYLAHLSSNANYTAAVSDCLEFLDGSLRYIAKSREGLKSVDQKKVKDLKAWMSAAHTYQYDCSSALTFVNTTKEVGSAMEQLVTVQSLTSNALSMLDALDTYGENMDLWKPPATERSTRASIEAQWRNKIDYSDNIWGVLAGKAVVPNVIVSKDGPLRSIQKAVDSAPDDSEQRFVIYIKGGVYEETVKIPPKKVNVMFVGDGIDKTVITESKSVPSLPAPITTYGSATVAVNADGFMARDITFQNSAGAGKNQAVALRVDGDLSAFHNCAILGNQDTLYTHSLRQFYKNCRIEGTIDFIFGNSAAIFENCLILVRPRLKIGWTNPVTAQGRTDPAQSTGLVFQNCSINGTEEYTRDFHENPTKCKAYLGRPWKMYSRAIFMNSFLGEIISAEGWFPWNGQFALDTLYYGEYHNYGPGADLSGRVSWSSQVPEENVGIYSVQSFIQGDEWPAATSN